MSLLLAQQTVPFGVALALLLGLTALEAVGLLLSFSPSLWLDHALPHWDGDTALSGVLGWLHLGKVPLLILLVLFLLGFALAGYGVQMVVGALVGRYLPAAAAALPALLAGVGMVRVLGRGLARLVPRDESSDVSEQGFIGCIAVVTAASEREDWASQARLLDRHGRAHYILAEPDAPGLRLCEGMQVLLVKKAGKVFRVIENPHPALL